MSIIQRPDCEGGDMDSDAAREAYEIPEAETVETPTLSDAELLALAAGRDW